MQTHITPNNKLASLGTIGLLFLAGIAGMVFLLPALPAHATGPTVTLSTLTITTGGVLTPVSSATVGTTLVVQGFGFDPATPITITTAVGTTTVPWLNNPGSACATTNGGISSAATPIASLVSNAGTNAGCLITTAVGNFGVEVVVPNLPGGAQTVTVSDGTNTGTASFTVTPKVSVTYTGNNFGFPHQAISPTIKVTGFGSGESVSVATAMWTTASFSCSTGSSVSTVIGTGYGSCSVGGSTAVTDTTGGAKTITATGATSGLTATATYTVNPWAAFYNSQAGVTAFSFLGTAPTSLLVEVHGLAAGTIAANSITIGGVSTNHAAVTIGSSGAYGGASSFLVVSPTANVPFGPASVVIGGTSFSYAAGNVAYGSGTWGGVLISSIIGTGSSTGVATTDASSYKPGTGFTASTTSPAPAQNQIGIFGYGFTQPSHAITITAATGLSVTPVIAPGNADANGAFFSTQTLGDTSWSTSAAPTTAASYALTVTQASGPSNILSPSIGITPWIESPAVATVDYQTSTEAVNVHGFGATDVVTMTIGGTAMVSGGATAAAVVNGAGTTVAGTVPDLAGGAQNVVATGSITGQSVTSVGAVTYQPMVGPTTAGQALSINSGGAGQTTVLRTGAGYGVHGLLANDGYQIVWNAIGGSITVGSFTATATGGIPIPGVQFTIPSDSSGIHIIDIQNTGSYAIFGSLFNGQLTPTESPFSSQYITGYGDLLFSNVALLQAAPSVAVVGSPETLSGSGLAAGASYVVTLSSNPTTVTPNSAAALATFTATGTGSVPSGTIITLSDTPSVLETGTREYFTVQTNAHYGVAPYSADAYAQFVLAASANLNMTSAPAGHPVVITAHALNSAGAVYNVVFNYVQSAFNSLSYTGTTVGVIAPNSVGQGSATFNVPTGALSGTYTVQLVVTSQGTNGAPVGTGVLNVPLSLTVGSVSSTSCNTTNCMAAGASTPTTIGPNKAIQTSFTNTSNSPVTAIVYAVVHNALGQTVAYSTATITANPGASATAYNILFGLAPGTYSVTIFATSTSGTAISTSSTVSVTI